MEKPQQMGKVVESTSKGNEKSLTVEKLRTFPCFENLSDEEAQAILFSLESFAALLFDYHNQMSAESNNDSLNIAA